MIFGIAESICNGSKAGTASTCPAGLLSELSALLDHLIAPCEALEDQLARKRTRFFTSAGTSSDILRR